MIRRAALLLVVLGCGRTAGRPDGLTAAPPVLVYVANQASGKVTVINAATDSIVATVDFAG